MHIASYYYVLVCTCMATQVNEIESVTLVILYFSLHINNFTLWDAHNLWLQPVYICEGDDMHGMPMSEVDGLKAADIKCFENNVAIIIREFYTYINTH